MTKPHTTLSEAVRALELPEPHTGQFEYCVPGERITRIENGYTVDQVRALLSAAAALVEQHEAQEPVLTVWEGAMPESNGKSNFTAVLTRKRAKGFDVFEDGFTIARSEYPDRVRYEADCVRYLIGELSEKPWIADYDADKHSGYVEKPTLAATQAGNMSSKWGYCPECGSEEVRHEEGEHKQCAACRQEWFADIDYTDVVRGHLAKRTQAGDAKDAARYRWLRHGDNDERVIQHGPVAPDYHWLPRNSRLDDMIDAAMSPTTTRSE